MNEHQRAGWREVGDTLWSVAKFFLAIAAICGLGLLVGRLSHSATAGVLTASIVIILVSLGLPFWQIYKWGVERSQREAEYKRKEEEAAAKWKRTG